MCVFRDWGVYERFERSWYFESIDFVATLCCNLSFGLATKARGCKVAGEKGSPGVTSHVLGSAKNVREWTLTLPSELPFWELESQWISKLSKGNFRDQNPSVWRVLYIIGKLLKCRCLKWTHITHLNIWNTSYGQKKGQESNWQFDFWLVKVRNRPNFLAFRWRATYYWKAFDESYNISWNLIGIKGLHTKLWAPKVAGVPFGMMHPQFLAGLKCESQTGNSGRIRSWSTFPGS